MKAQIYDIVRLAGLSPGEILPEVSVQQLSLRMFYCVLPQSLGGTGRHLCWPSRPLAETFGRKNPTRMRISRLGGSVAFPPGGIWGGGKQPGCEGGTGTPCQALQHGGRLPSSQAVH